MNRKLTEKEYVSFKALVESEEARTLALYHPVICMAIVDPVGKSSSIVESFSRPLDKVEKPYIFHRRRRCRTGIAAFVVAWEEMDASASLKKRWPMLRSFYDVYVLRSDDIEARKIDSSTFKTSITTLDNEKIAYANFFDAKEVEI